MPSIANTIDFFGKTLAFDTQLKPARMVNAIMMMTISASVSCIPL